MPSKHKSVSPRPKKASKRVVTLETIYQQLFKTTVPPHFPNDASYSLRQPSPFPWIPSYTSTGASDVLISR